MNNILIIGNGFDLAHDLPTKYNDFLDICIGVQKIENQEIQFSSLDEDGCIGNLKFSRLKEFIYTIGNDTYSIFYRFMRENIWIKYIIRKRDKLGENWISFENEIETVIKSIVTDKNKADDDIIKHLSNKDFYNILPKSTWTYDKLLSYLKFQADLLIKLMSIYFYEYVNKLGRDTIESFRNIEYSKVLSFNYTNTFQRLYNQNIEVCYIHGEARPINDIQNLVLGFDDHYFGTAQVVPETIPFEKYYQRIVNQNDNCYLKWIPGYTMDASKPTTVHIYGHSLTPYDGDIIKYFVQAPNTSTIVFCCNKENDIDRKEKIKNLAIILGPDKLIELAGGYKPRITFEYC